MNMTFPKVLKVYSMLSMQRNNKTADITIDVGRFEKYDYCF